VQSLVWLALLGVLAARAAVGPAIGVAVVSGTFRVDHSRVSGNISLYEGNVIETDKAQSEVELHGGIRMQLGPESRARFYRDRMVLEQGQAVLETDTPYRIEALSLRVSPAGHNSSARVSFDTPQRVNVVALGGSVRVANSSGVQLADLPPGKALEFEPEAQAAGAAAPSTVTGSLDRRSGRFLLRDETTRVTVEITAPAGTQPSAVSGVGVTRATLETSAGRRVEVTGILDISARPTPGASEVLQATNLKALPAPVAANVARSGMAVSTKAIIAGVVVAAAGAGAGIGLTSASDEKTSLSR
jgi:hypothetical protein